MTTKENGEQIAFLKEKNYVMINNNLGGGSFGKTVVIEDPFIKERFVAKKYEPEDESNREIFYKNFLDEIRILYKLNHPNVVRIYNYYPYVEKFTGYIVMEFIDGKGIGRYFREYDENDYVLDMPGPDEIFKQLIDAFCHIEQHRIVHRDIRETNILIDKNGMVKVIDFGIGKVFNSKCEEDSLASKINRANSDTLPQEYFDGEYTTLTDMFYLGELFNRLIKDFPYLEEMPFSYQGILERMINKVPEKRFASFSAVRDAMNKYRFEELNISEEEKRIYQEFVNGLCTILKKYTSPPRFVTDANEFLVRLEKLLENNLFEDLIQNNALLIRSKYVYSNTPTIPRTVVACFVDWLETGADEAKQLVLSNITTKLMTIHYEKPEVELPF